MASTLTHSLLHAPQRRGLLGLGGFGGNEPPAGLLGRYYDPAEERRRKISGAMTQAGIQLLTNGRGSFGEVLGQGLAGAVQGANNAGINYREDALGYQQLAQQQLDQQEKERQKAAVMQWLDTLPEDQQELARVNPEMAAKAFMERQFAGPGEGFTLGEGQDRYDATGRKIASGSPKVPTPTDDMREYEMAKQQGYGGTFQQYMIEMKKAGASSVNVNGDQKLTEGQSKDLGFYSRGIYANAELDRTESALLSLSGNMAGGAGVVGNYLKDPKYRQAERSGREVLAVILRKDTGAAVTPAEFELYGPMYLPWPGDDQQTLADKREARARALNGIRLGGGTARPLYEDIDKQFSTDNPPVNQSPRSLNPTGTGKTRNGVPWKVLQ